MEVYIKGKIVNVSVAEKDDYGCSSCFAYDIEEDCSEIMRGLTGIDCEEEDCKFIKEKSHLISCIGVDRKKHVCYPWKDVTECGVKILKKKLTDSDYTEHFGCYECTY